MRRISCLLMVLALFVTVSALSAADQSSVASGRAVGEITPSFVVLDVTGPHKGEAICYVCEWRGDPTIIAFFQDSGDETAALLTRLNDLVKQNAGKKLKAVGVMIAGPDKKPWVEKLAQEKGINIPLVVFRKGKDDLNMKLYKINPEAKNTFLVNVDRKVNANLTNVSESSFNQVADAASKMLAAQKN